MTLEVIPYIKPGDWCYKHNGCGQECDHELQCLPTWKSEGSLLSCNMVGTKAQNLVLSTILEPKMPKKQIAREAVNGSF